MDEIEELVRNFGLADAILLDRLIRAELKRIRRSDPLDTAAQQRLGAIAVRMNSIQRQLNETLREIIYQQRDRQQHNAEIDARLARNCRVCGGKGCCEVPNKNAIQSCTCMQQKENFIQRDWVEGVTPI
jgi:hypothetical protein